MDIPCSVWIFMESAPTPRRSDDEPAMVRSLITKDRKEVLSEALRNPVVPFTWLLANVKAHLLDERMVKKI